MVSAPTPNSSVCPLGAANSLQVFKNAGHFGSLSIDLVHYLFSSYLTRSSDQLALGRTCRWLHTVVQQTHAWQLLFHPTSPFAPFTRPVLGPHSSQFSLPVPFELDSNGSTNQLVCLPVGRISRTLAWVTRDQRAPKIGCLVYADQLALRSIHLSPPDDPLPTVSGDADGGDRSIAGQVYLPLFLNMDHFDAGFPLLHSQAARILEPLRNPQTAYHPMARLIVTEFFPQLARNTSTRLALSANPPTVNDVEALVQVHMVWRAYIHRHALDAPSWITSKLHELVNTLNRGGVHARQVPLMELVSLLHMSTEKNLTWAKIGARVVEENMIRLFEYVRGCGGCTAKLKERAADKIGKSALRLANKVAQAQADGYGFVPWQVLLFQVRFMRATSSIPTMGPLAAFARLVGQLQDDQHLIPGSLARLLHSYLAQDIRQTSGLCTSWSGICRGLGAAPMEPAAFTKWLNWCDTQVKCRSIVVRVFRGIAFKVSCPVCPSTSTGDLSLSAIILCRGQDDAEAPEPLSEEPDFSFIALNTHGAILGVHSDMHGIQGKSFGFFAKHSFGTNHGHDFNGKPLKKILLQLNTLDARVAYVVVVASTHDSKSTVCAGEVDATGRCFRSSRDIFVQDKEPSKVQTSRLTFVACRGLDNGKWDLVRANVVPRNGLVFKLRSSRPSTHLWHVRPNPGAVSQGRDEWMEGCVGLAQEWVAEYTRECHLMGLDAMSVAETEFLERYYMGEESWVTR